MTLPLPVCRRCGRVAVTTQTRYGERCQCPVCHDWSWNRKPMADMRTHEARRAAHEAFDTLWSSGQMSRGHAYTLLAGKLGLTRDECHMSLMDAETAERVPAIAEAMWETSTAEHLQRTSTDLWDNRAALARARHRHNIRNLRNPLS